MTDNPAVGRKGEFLARRLLEEKGFEIVETNYRYGKGEIDIIARMSNVLVFCEVKARCSDQFGEPEHAVTLKKQQQIRRIANAYLFEHGIQEQECRFDVIAIRLDGEPPVLRHIENAF